jgi:hypothetical protein
MGASVDCELIGPGLLAQPVNASTCLALVVAGLVVARRSRIRWIGYALVAAGIGSFLFHGPLAPGGSWIHDVTLAWLLLVVAGFSRPWEVLSRRPGLAALAALIALAPASAGWATSVILAGAAISVLEDDRSRATLLPLLLLAATAVIGRLGATGGPLCDPGSLLQAHGLWHVGSAIAVAWWAIGRERRLQAGSRDHAIPPSR